MTTQLASVPDTAATSAARNRAYRRLAATILGVDVKRLSADLALNRTRPSGLPRESRYLEMEAALR